MVQFLRDVKIELTKVTYPSKEEVIRLSMLVIVISLFVGIYLGTFDFIFTKFLEFIVK